MENINYYWNHGLTLLLAYAPKVLLAVVTLILGLWLVKKMSNVSEKLMAKNNMEVSLKKFLISLSSILLKTMLIISVISMVGIEPTSFVAVLASAGFAVGMALQGSLGNFAGGVLILMFKPFKVGDTIEAQGFTGTVGIIGIFNTTLKTFDNRTIIIPNSPLSSGPITNLTTEPTRRVDMAFSVSYKDDVSLAKQLINDLILNDERILKDPEPFVAVSELGSSSVNLTVRVWCETANYWNIYFDMQEKVKLEFDKSGITIPFPQTDLHVYNKLFKAE